MPLHPRTRCSEGSAAAADRAGQGDAVQQLVCGPLSPASTDSDRSAPGTALDRLIRRLLPTVERIGKVSTHSTPPLQRAGCVSLALGELARQQPCCTTAACR